MTTLETQMQTQNQASPMLKSIDLIRVEVEQLCLTDLEVHAVEVIDTIAALNAYINGPQHKSHNALVNAQNLSRKLRTHMARVRDLIQVRQSAVVVMQSMQSASAPSLSALPSMGRRSRVIRPPAGADNAASGHIQVLSNDPQGRGAKAVCGGEAKEAGARPHDGEASMEAKR